MRAEVSDAQWALIAPHLPPKKRRGRPRADDRRTFEGILCVLRTGAQWDELPKRYGSKSTCHRRLQEWQRLRVWERIWRAFLSTLDAQGKLQWSEAFLDGTFVPAKKGGSAVGLTKRGKGTKVMLVTDGEGIPLGTLVASAQKAEVKLAEATLVRVQVPRRGPGHPRRRPKMLVADRGYDSRALRTRLRRRGIRPCIPQRRNHRLRPGRRADLAGYRRRWHVERTFAWLGNCYRLTVRRERHASLFYAFVLIAIFMLCLRRILG